MKIIKDVRRAGPALIMAGVALMGAAGAVSADRIKNPIPVPDHSVTYNLAGGGSGTLALPGSGQGLALKVYSNLTLHRKVTKVTAEGAVTTDQTITAHQITVNDQEVSMGTPPTVSVTTDPSGKVLTVAVAGKPSAGAGGLSDVQSSLQQFQLPNKDFKPGDAWTETLVMPDSSTPRAAVPQTASLEDTYIGMKTNEGKTLMQFTRKLQKPVELLTHGVHSMGGFDLTGMTIQAVDQTALYDPQSGELVSSTTHVDVSLKLQMGTGLFALPLAATVPLDVKTIQVTAATTGPARPAPTTPAPQKAAITGKTPLGSGVPAAGDGVSATHN